MAGKTEYYINQEKALLATGRAAGILDSSTSKGRAREQIISDFLRTHLPKRVTVERGEVIDRTRRSSGEVEVILVDHESSVLCVGGESVVPVEAAVGLIEVKSSLSGSNLVDAMRKIARSKALTRTQHHGLYRTDSSHAVKIPIPPQSTNGYIVAYDGPSWEHIGARLNENSEWYRHDYMTYGPEVICILTKGFAYKNDLHLFSPSPGLEHLDVVHIQNMPGLEVIIYHIEEYLHRYGALTYELGPYYSGAVNS
jgi:hypothetical protein